VNFEVRNENKVVSKWYYKHDVYNGNGWNSWKCFDYFMFESM